MDFKIGAKRALGAVFSIAVIVAFQNCSPTRFESMDTIQSSTADSSGADTGYGLPPGSSYLSGFDNPYDIGTGNPKGADGPYSGSTQSKSKLIEYNPGFKKLDIVLMIDNSGSMETDGKRLAAKLAAFVTNLSSLKYDWQMCYVNADRASLDGSNGDNSQTWLLPSGSAQVLKPQASVQALNSIIVNSINKLYASGYGNASEKGVAALNMHAKANSLHNCYRSNATIVSVIISDEDELSGWYKEGYYGSSYSKTTLATENLPSNYINTIQNLQKSLNDGTTRPFIANALVIRSADRTAGSESTCFKSQGGEFYNGGTQTMISLNQTSYGFNYENLVNMTGGHLGDVCASDYGAILNNISTKIEAVASSIKLDCVPVKAPVITTNPVGANLQVAYVGDTIIYRSQSQTSFSIKIDYTCKL